MLASLALHLALVVGWPRMQERLRAAPSPPIVSRLVEAAPSVPPSAAAAQAQAEPKPRPEPEPPKIKPAPETHPLTEKAVRVKKPAPTPLAKSAERAPEPQRAPKPAATDSSPPPAAEAGAPTAAVVPAPSPAPGPHQAGPSQPVQPQAAQPAIDAATTIAQYRMQVLSAARRLKSRYPDLARENNWSGSVVVALAVGSDGATEVRLKTGTGHAPLDQQASEMFRQAARAVPLPPPLQGRAFSVELKAVYGLVD